MNSLIIVTIGTYLIIVTIGTYLHMKKRTKATTQRMLMMTASPVKTVAARNAGDKIVPKSSRRPRQISLPSWLQVKR